MAPEIASWPSFARQKGAEIVTLRRGLTEDRSVIADAPRGNTDRLAIRATSPIIRAPAVRERVAAVTDADLHRTSP